jgi:hypothetical protein
MIKWLKSLFGFDTPDTPVIAQEPVKTVAPELKVETPAPVAKTKTQAKKPATKKKTATKAASSDLDAMNKTQLLAEAKKRGVKANASLKKAEILEAIKNG